MEQAEAPEFLLDVFADPRSVRDVVRAILHTIFFNRFFPSVHPRTVDVLDLTLPYVDDDELATMIEQRAAALERQLEAERFSTTSTANTAGTGTGAASGQATSFATQQVHGGSTGVATASSASGARGQISVQFFEKRRRKAWLSRGDEEVCWESWTVKVTVAEPRTESGRFSLSFFFSAITVSNFHVPSFLKKEKEKTKKKKKLTSAC